MKTPSHQRVIISRDNTPSKSHTPKKRNSPEDYDKENAKPPTTPGFNDLPMLHCAGPAIEDPQSPTISIKRRDLGKKKINKEEDQEVDQEEEEETDHEPESGQAAFAELASSWNDEFEQLWHAIKTLRQENETLKERITELEKYRTKER